MASESVQDTLDAGDVQGALNAPDAQDPDAYSLLYMMYGHSKSVTSIAFSYDGQKIATGGADKLVNIWQVHTGRMLHTLEGHTHGVNGVCWTRDSAYVASVSDDRSVRLWDAESVRIKSKCVCVLLSHTAGKGHLVRTFLGHTSYVMCVACHPLSTLLISGGFDETIRMWDIQRGTCHREIAAHSEAVTCVDFCMDGTMIASSSYDGLM